MAEDITDDIVEAALTPAEVEGDAGRVKQRSIEELIAADKYAKQNVALAGGKSAWGATRPARMVPPGSIGPGNIE